MGWTLRGTHMLTHTPTAKSHSATRARMFIQPHAYTKSDAYGTDQRYSSRSTLYQIYQIYSDMQE